MGARQQDRQARRWFPGSKTQEAATQSGVLMSPGGFSDQASHSGEVVEHIGQEDQGGHAGEAKDRQALEAPGFEGGIATFNGIAGAVIEFFPGRRTNRKIPNQTDGSIRKALPQVDDATMGMVGDW